MIYNRDYRAIMRRGKLLIGNEPADLPEIGQNRAWIGLILIILALMAIFLVCGCNTPAIADTTITASWYSTESLKKEGTWLYSKGQMSNGHIFSDNDYTCACRILPLGSILRIRNVISGRCVIVRVTDRIGRRFANKRIDLSKRAFAQIADLNKGLITVSIERIK